MLQGGALANLVLRKKNHDVAKRSSSVQGEGPSVARRKSSVTKRKPYNN